MARFREIKTRQKFVLAHASIHTHFDLERHLVARDDFKNCRSPALVEWREIAA
jgi:putative transposase